MHTEVRFAKFLSGGFITAIVVNLRERKLAKRISVQWGKSGQIRSELQNLKENSYFHPAVFSQEFLKDTQKEK